VPEIVNFGVVTLAILWGTFGCFNEDFETRELEEGDVSFPIFGYRLWDF
jgi:hypothetical protein